MLYFYVLFVGRLCIKKWFLAFLIIIYLYIHHHNTVDSVDNFYKSAEFIGEK